MTEEGKLWLSRNETPMNKRKIEESPVLKQAMKLVKGDPEQIIGTTTSGELGNPKLLDPTLVLSQ